jgi:hypothetical protein
MTTTGSTAFNLDMNDLIEEAFERCGLEVRSGYDFRTARRSLNILTIEWANRGINLWTVEQGQIVMNTQQALYPMPIDTIDILDASTRTSNGSQSNQTDINLSRISEPTYMTIPNKNTTGRPIQMWYNRQSGGVANVPQTILAQNITATDTNIYLQDIREIPTQGFVNIVTTGGLGGAIETVGYQNVIPAPQTFFPNAGYITNAWRGQNGTTAAAKAAGSGIYVNNLPCINVWPTPNAPGDQYTLVYYRMRRIQDAGNGIRTQDIPFRFIPCMVAGLAYYLSAKIPGVDPNRMQMLKAEYEQQFQLAADEDRETAAVRFVPRNMFYR